MESFREGRWGVSGEGGHKHGGGGVFRRRLGSQQLPAITDNAAKVKDRIRSGIYRTEQGRIWQSPGCCSGAEKAQLFGNATQSTTRCIIVTEAGASAVMPQWLAEGGLFVPPPPDQPDDPSQRTSNTTQALPRGHDLRLRHASILQLMQGSGDY